MNKNILKAITWTVVVLLISCAAYYLFVLFIFTSMFNGPEYDASDLIENYEQKELEIQEAITYFQTILPSETTVDIEFDDDEIAIFHTIVKGKYDSNWNVKYHSTKADSLLNQIGWSYKNLSDLKSKLNAANCISIAGSNNVTIGWQRSGMGMFSYHIFDHALNATEIEANNGGCTHIFYKDNIALGYGGGAIGPQCFPKYQRPETD